MIHTMKCSMPKFQQILDGNRIYDVRTDRGFTTGDTINLQEWDGTAYTGRTVSKKIGWKLGKNWLRPQDSDQVNVSLEDL